MNKHTFLTLFPIPITRLAVLATLCLAQIVWAQTESDVPYLDANSVKRYADNVTLITSANIATINNLDGWYLVRGNLTRNITLTVSGVAHIILENGSNLRVTGSSENAGINVAANNSVTIYAQSEGNNMGKLTAIGGDGSYSGAGIGGIGNASGGNNTSGIITINGGMITTIGGSSARSSSNTGSGAGIGGGGGNNGNNGIITINGGTITATGGSASGSNGCAAFSGAGVGGGGRSNGGGISNTITISGGTVTAISGNASSSNVASSGAGIGDGGYYGGTSGTITITISGGTVIATGSRSGDNKYIGAGIGNGGFSSSDNKTGTLAMSGNAVVFASSVSDNSSKSGGILVIGSTTNWYGSSSLTLSPIQYTVPTGYTLTIPSGKTLTIPNGATLINNGTVTPADNSTIVINGTRTGNLIQGANVSVPTLASRTATSITANEAVLLAATGQVMEYAKNTAYTAPASGWQTETTFEELNEGTSYFIFTRSKANTNFAAGAPQRARIAVAADLSFTIPTGRIYSGNPQGIGTVSPRSGVGGMGAITVLYNGSTTIPTNAGTYEIKVNIAKGDEFAAVAGVVLGEYVIAPKPITVTADAKTKVYGTADPMLTYSVAPALASGDNISGSLARADGENVGDYAISQGTLSANGNYELTFVGVNFTITPKPIAVAAEAKTKVYGSPNPELIYSITSELINGDNFSGELSRVEGENAGDYAISQGTLTAGGNYELIFTSANFAITPKPIVASGLSANSKIYDGTATAAVAGTATISGAIDGDDVTVVCTASFANKNVGTDKAVSFNCSPSGANGGNYTLSAQPASVTADITAKPITVTATAGQSKAYGTLDHEFAYSVEPTLASGDNFGGELSCAEGESVGSYAINQGTLTAGSNYSITFESANFAITAKPVTITGVSAASKEYDGRTAATVTGTAMVRGKVGSDDVTAVCTASFADSNAGIGKPVTFNCSLGGTDAGNYVLSEQPASVTANIISQSSPILSHKTAKGNRLLTPTQNGITLTANTTATITVYNLSGKLISQQNYNAGSHSISLGHLPKGMYIVKAAFGGGKEILRVAVR